MRMTDRKKAPSLSPESIWKGPYILRKWALFWAALFVLAWSTPSSFGLLICGGVALHSLRSTRRSVEALGILMFVVISGKTDFSLGRWLILFTASLRMFWDGAFGGKSMPQLAYLLLLFFAVMLPLSVLTSVLPLVSILKLTTFTTGSVLMTVGLYQTRQLLDYWMSWFFTLGVFILLASIPFYGLPAGYATNEVGFQGILTHPQFFGVVLAPITAFLMGLYFFRQQTSWVLLLLAVLGMVEMYFTLSRTSLGALVLAGATTAAVGFSFKLDTWGVSLSRALGRPAAVIGGLMVLALVALQWTTIQSSLESFLAKDEESVSIVQNFEESRGALVSQSMANFRKRPLTGVGFGAPSDPAQYARIERGPYGIPISAPVEKGFMPSAVLGETGIIGAMLTLVLLVFLFAPVVRRADPTLFWVMATCLFLNLGEMAFFSLGGVGFFLWFVMALCHVAALKTEERRQMARTRAPAHASGRHR